MNTQTIAYFLFFGKVLAHFYQSPLPFTRKGRVTGNNQYVLERRSCSVGHGAGI